MKHATLILITILILVPIRAFAISEKDLHAVLAPTVYYDESDELTTNNGAPPGTAQAPGNPQGNIALGQKLAQDFGGWGVGDQWNCLYTLFEHESGWNELADNPTSDAYGIPQALPGSKMSSEGSDWQTNPQTQIMWGLKYIAGRYITPCNAWAFWQSPKGPGLPQGNWY